MFLLSLTSAILFWQSFPGSNNWWLSFFAFVPFFSSIKKCAKGWEAVLSGLLFGVVFSALSGSWMIYCSDKHELVRLWMFVAFTYGISFAIAGFGIYQAFLKGFPLTFVAPIWIVGCCFLRSLIPGLDNWVDIALSLYSNLLLIQIADIAGTAGVVFVVLVINSIIVDFFFLKRSRNRLHILAVIMGLFIIAANICYGTYQLKYSQKNFEKGPLVSVVSVGFKLEWCSALIEALQSNPDIIVLPECISDVPLNDSVLNSQGPMSDFSVCRNRFLYDLSTAGSCIFVVGSVSVDGDSYYNSAFVYEPKSKKAFRYDKVKLVPFGEYIPEGKLWSFLNKLVGWRNDGIFFTPGSRIKTFSPKLKTGEKISFATPICFEDSDSEYFRKLVNSTNEGEKVDLALCLIGDRRIPSLDQWEQHLAHAVFRAVENKVPLARSNTSISAIISPTGHVVNRILTDENQNQVALNHVSLCSRKTFYGRYGNWFSTLCVVLILSSLFLFYKVR